MPTKISQPRRLFVRVALAALGVLAMSEANADLFGGLFATKSPFPVTKSGLEYINLPGVQPIFWLDNDRAMFPARVVGNHTEEEMRNPKTAPHTGIYIWDVKHNTYTRYVDLPAGLSLFQYDHGNIAYFLDNKPNGDSVAMVGKMGEEKRVDLKGGVMFTLNWSRVKGRI